MKKHKSSFQFLRNLWPRVICKNNFPAQTNARNIFPPKTSNLSIDKAASLSAIYKLAMACICRALSHRKVYVQSERFSMYIKGD